MHAHILLVIAGFVLISKKVPDGPNMTLTLAGGFHDIERREGDIGSQRTSSGGDQGTAGRNKQKLRLTT